MIYPQFLQCMAAFLNDRPSEPFTLDAAAWGQLYRLAKRQSLSGALFVAARTVPMPDTVFDRLRRDGFLTLTAFEDRRTAIDEIAARFDALQIAHLFFKGAVVATYYPQPAMRSMGDIDMVIHPADRERANAAMTAMGFACSSRSGEVWVYERRGLLIEMHTVVRRFDVRRQEPVAYESLWTDARRIQGHTYHLSDEAELVHAVHHLTAHFSAGGCGLRQVMDVAVLYRRFVGTSVWDEAKERLEADGLLAFTRHLLWFSSLALQTEVEAEDAVALEEPFAAQFAERLLGDGTFGKDERLLLSQQRRQARGATGGRRLAQWFPSAAAMRERYAYLEARPWLLPAAYVQRAFDGVTKNRRIHERRKRYASQANDELAADIALFDALGL